MSSNTRLLPLVWPSKYIKGIHNLNGPHIHNGKPYVPELGYSMSLEQALQQEHPSDAHLTCYALKDNDGTFIPAIPLMTKGVLRQVQAEGADLYMTCIGLDWDTPGHIPLTPKLFCGFLEDFLSACEKDDRLGQWRAYYTSRHGARVFYELLHPVQVLDGEKYIVSLLKEFKKHDVSFDVSCKDWTRRFRLPKVVRDGLPTTKEPCFNMQMQEKYLDIKQFKKSELKSLVVSRDFKRKATYPSQEVCRALLIEEGSQGKEVMTGYHKKAKALIRHTDFFDAIFTNSVSLCGNTGRNEFFQRMLGILVPKLIDKCSASPEQIFALLEGPLCELEILEGKQEPAQHCWNFLQDIYEREFAKYADAEEKKAQEIEEGQNALGKMAEGMRQWCNSEELFDNDNLVVESYVRGHLFANVGKFYYPMDKDGWYSNLCLIKDQLVPRIRKSFLKGIIETEKTDLRNEPTSVSPVEISNNHSTIVHEIRMSPLQGSQGRIDRIDGDHPVLQLPMYQRNDFLPAVPNDAVDGWLRALFGENVEKAKEWIGYALDFEAGPICALSLAGDGGVGKKMLVEGLAECLVDPCSATALDMVGTVNGALIKTPFLFVNEGMPKARDMSPSDTFKSYMAGDPIPVRELYKPRISVINPLRIIFTANDHGLLHELTRGKELTPETKKAVGERLLHFDVGNEAVAYLKRLGGRAFTEREGARWIRGDSGQPSNFVVAKHFMSLYKDRPRRTQTERYCVMGNCAESESFQIASRSEFLPIVMRGIAGIFEKPGSLKDHRIRGVGGRAFITLHGVLAYIRTINEERIGERALEGIIKSLLIRSAPFEKNNLYYYELDIQAVLDFTMPWSIPCGVLIELHEISKGQIV